MIWDGAPYLCPNNKKTLSLANSVLYLGRRSLLPLSRSAQPLLLFCKKIDEITGSFVVYTFYMTIAECFFPDSFEVIPS